MNVNQSLLNSLSHLLNIVWVWLSGMMFLDMTIYTNFFLVIESALSIVTAIFNDLNLLAIQYSNIVADPTSVSPTVNQYIYMLWSECVIKMQSLVTEIFNIGSWFSSTNFVRMASSELSAIEQLLYQMNRLSIDSQLQILYSYFLEATGQVTNMKVQYLLDGVKSDCQNIYSHTLSTFFIVREDRESIQSQNLISSRLQISLQNFDPLFKSLCDKLKSLLSLINITLTSEAATAAVSAVPCAAASSYTPTSLTSSIPLSSNPLYASFSNPQLSYDDERSSNEDSNPEMTSPPPPTTKTLQHIIPTPRAPLASDQTLPPPRRNPTTKFTKNLIVRDIKFSKKYRATYEVDRREDIEILHSMDMMEVDDLSQLVQSHSYNGRWVIPVCIPSEDGLDVQTVGNIVLHNYF